MALSGLGGQLSVQFALPDAVGTGRNEGSQGSLSLSHLLGTGVASVGTRWDPRGGGLRGKAQPNPNLSLLDPGQPLVLALPRWGSPQGSC